MIDSPNRTRGPWSGVGSVVTMTVIAVGIGIIFSDHIAAEWNAREAELEIIDLEKRIPTGATREQVAALFALSDYDHLRLRTHGKIDRWYFHTPFRFGASDWILVVTFDRGHVVALRVGTSDNIGRSPNGAPPPR